VPRVRFAVQDGHQSTVFTGPNTERQTDGTAGVHQRGDRGRPGREPHNDRTAGRSGLRGRGRQSVSRPPAPDRTGATQRSGVRDDTLWDVPSGNAAPVRTPF